MGKLLWINEYGSIVEDVRKVLSKLKIKNERTFEVAVVLLFSRITLTMVEIYTLLSCHYPEGALALSRLIIEGSVILEYICKNKNNTGLIERFFDNSDISALKFDKAVKNTLRTKTNKLVDSSNEKRQLEDFIRKHEQFYDAEKGYFSDYWWVEKNCNFSTLARKTSLGKEYPYTLASQALHISSYNCQNYCEIEERGILIGETSDGLETPAWISMLYYFMAMNFLNECDVANFSGLISRAQQLLNEISIQ